MDDKWGNPREPYTLWWDDGEGQRVNLSDQEINMMKFSSSRFMVLENGEVINLNMVRLLRPDHG
jgi:hypothetical protein